MDTLGAPCQVAVSSRHVVVHSAQRRWGGSTASNDTPLSWRLRVSATAAEISATNGAHSRSRNASLAASSPVCQRPENASSGITVTARDRVSAVTTAASSESSSFAAAFCFFVFFPRPSDRFSPLYALFMVTAVLRPDTNNGKGVAGGGGCSRDPPGGGRAASIQERFAKRFQLLIDEVQVDQDNPPAVQLWTS